MGMDLNLSGELKKCLGHAVGAANHELDKQRLRILRCTAQAMASSPGGLRFKAGTRPWLEGLADGRQAPHMANSRRKNVYAQPTAD
ncbi:MAG: hypothetical protein WAW69_09240 [Polaromonas sp.]